MMTVVTGILLAGGRGQRFGGHKLEARLDNGMRLGLTSAQNLHPIVSSMLVVVAAGDKRTESMFVDAGYRVVIAEHAALGMGHSLACGVAHADKNQSVLIALADMPWIGSATLQAVVAALGQGAGIVVPRHREQAGHPVGFASRFHDELTQLGGDRGARELIKAHAREVQYLDLADPGVLRDVDRPQDLLI